MGLVQKETLVVFYIRMPRETERHQRKKRRTQEYLASNEPLIAREDDKVKRLASSSVPTRKRTN